jgi:hypothetical protein
MISETCLLLFIVSFERSAITLMQTWIPDPAENLDTWFETAIANADPSVQKGAKSIILLTMWRL